VLRFCAGAIHPWTKRWCRSENVYSGKVFINAIIKEMTLKLEPDKNQITNLESLEKQEPKKSYFLRNKTRNLMICLRTIIKKRSG